MIQIRFEVKYEDRFHVFLREFLRNYNFSIYSNIETLDKESFVDKSLDKRYVSKVFKYQGAMINHLFNFLQECEGIMGIPIEVRFVTSIGEAYDAGTGLYTLPWLKFSKS